MHGFTKSQAAGFFMTGALVGATIALLYAPKTGAQTRKNIRKFSEKTVNRLDDLQEDIRDQVSDWVEDVGTAVKDSLDAGRKFSTQGYEHVMDVFDNAKKVVEGGKAKIGKMIQTA
jgi:gas vesicle protein